MLAHPATPRLINTESGLQNVADFRKDNGPAIRKVCREFVVLCRSWSLFTEAIVAIDGSKFKAVNNRDKNFTERKLQARMEQIEESIERYLVDDGHRRPRRRGRAVRSRAAARRRSRS